MSSKAGLKDNMKVMIVIFTFLLCFVAGDEVHACDTDTRATYFSDAFSQIIKGVPDLGISIDPLHLDSFEGDFVTFHFKHVQDKSIVTGLGNCKAFNFILSEDEKVINFEVEVPSYILSSSADYNGYLLHKYLNGHASMDVIYGRTVVRVYAYVNKVTDAQDNVYYSIGRFFLDVDGINQVKYNFIASDETCKSEELNEFVNNNWKATAVFAKGCVWDAIMTKMIEHLNKYLLHHPISV